MITTSVGAKQSAALRREATDYASGFSQAAFESGFLDCVEAVLAAPSALSAAIPARRRDLRIDVAALQIRPAYATAEHAIRDESHILYRAPLTADVEEDVLFYGPHTFLDRGHYELRLGDRIIGDFRLRLLDRFGADLLHEETVASEEQTLRFALSQPATKFEIVLSRLPSSLYFRSRGLRLRKLD